MVESPLVRACVVMTVGLCSTFIGYEYARAASITLLAAEETGLGSEALPLTVAVGSPASALVLYLYTRSIKKLGTKMTLRLSNLACIIMFIFMVFHCSQVKGLSGKVIVVVFYALREIYVSLLSSQQWAFISTTLDKSTSSYLVSFSGVVSVASAVGGCTVERLVTIGGVRGLLLTSLIATVIGMIAAESASSIVAHHQERKAIQDAERRAAGLSPYQTPKPSTDNLPGLVQQSLDDKKSNNLSASATSTETLKAKSTKIKAGFWRESWDLICSYPILQVLFFEAITHQICTNMLNIMFHNSLRFSSMDNEVKAKLVGRFFATVSIVSCGLQVFVLPTMLSQSSLPKILMSLPMIVFATVMIGVVHPSLTSVMLGFGTMKVLEYSIMHSASEMIYVPLGHEVRYVGKELVKFFGHKLGKSAASLLLSFLIARIQPSLMFQSIWGGAFSLIWAGSIFWLSSHLIERANADEAEELRMQQQLEQEEKQQQQLLQQQAVNSDDQENKDVSSLYGEASTVVTAEPVKLHGDASKLTSAPFIKRRDVRLTTSTSMPIFEIPLSSSTVSMQSVVSASHQQQRSHCTTEDETTTACLSDNEMAPFWMSDSEDGSVEKKASQSTDKLSTYLAQLRHRRANAGSNASAPVASLQPQRSSPLPVTLSAANLAVQQQQGITQHLSSSSLSLRHSYDANDERNDGVSTPSSMSSWYSQTSIESKEMEDKSEVDPEEEELVDMYDELVDVGQCFYPTLVNDDHIVTTNALTSADTASSSAEVADSPVISATLVHDNNVKGEKENTTENWWNSLAVPLTHVHRMIAPTSISSSSSPTAATVRKSIKEKTQ